MPLVRKPGEGGPSSPAATPGKLTLDALTSSNPQERWTAARDAGTLPGAIDAVARALTIESDPRVREALFTTLAQAGPESAACLISLLRSDQAQLRTGALDAMRTFGPQLRGLLPHLLNDDDKDLRILSCDLARELPADEATELLCQLLEREPQVNVCAAAIDVLAEVGTPAAADALRRCTARFPGNVFLAFSASTAMERITSEDRPTP